MNYELFFHNYSLIINEPNGSFCVYNGTNNISPTPTNPAQANLVSEISGTRTVFGIPFTYWSAVIIWAMNLSSDMHVDGTVNVRAYISSDFAISGGMSGGGYGMGLVDIDENNNEVQQFITEVQGPIGSNPFTSTPSLYSVNTTVDYVFKAGHSIGFAVGLGATSKGFTASVYFDSASHNSGATLPVENSGSNSTPSDSGSGSNSTSSTGILGSSGTTPTVLEFLLIAILIIFGSTVFAVVIFKRRHARKV